VYHLGNLQLQSKQNEAKILPVLQGTVPESDI
jgi:hypothetical protein